MDRTDPNIVVVKESLERNTLKWNMVHANKIQGQKIIIKLEVKMMRI